MAESIVTGGKINHHIWLAPWKIRSFEELETLPAATKPRTSHHRSPGGERRGKRKRSTIFLERQRDDHRPVTKHCRNCFKGNYEETSERRGGTRVGFSELIHVYNLKMNCHCNNCGVRRVVRGIN